MAFGVLNCAVDPKLMTAEVRKAIHFKKRNYNLLKEAATVEIPECYQHSHRACRTLIGREKASTRSK